MNITNEETLQAVNDVPNIIAIKKKNTLNTEITLIITKEVEVERK